MIGIYKITNLKNGLSYIGKSVNIQRRINEHHWPHVMPEVFTNENKQWHINNSGHSRSYLTDEEVMQIRKDYINLTLKEIYQKYSNYSERCLRGIVSGENYKYLPLYKKQKKVWLNGGTY